MPPMKIVLGVIAAVVGAGLIYVGEGKSAVRDELLDQGYQDVHVHADGVFTYTFDAIKAMAVCEGTVTRFPGSLSLEQTCRSLNGREVR